MGKKQGFTIIEVVVAMVLLAMAGVIAAVCVRTAGSLRAEEAKYQRADEEMVLQDSEVRKLLERQEMFWTYMQLKDAAGNNAVSYTHLDVYKRQAQGMGHSVRVPLVLASSIRAR